MIQVPPKKIIKAEILITQKCQIACEYCQMPKANIPEAPLSEWYNTFDILIDELGMTFAPIYGAEPTLYPNLPEVLRYLTEKGCGKTIITNGLKFVGKPGEEYLRMLIDNGLNSLTMSVDSLEGAKHVDKHTEVRSNVSLRSLLLAQELGVQDVEASITVNRKNLEDIPNMVGWFSSRGIWTTMDLVHWDRAELGNPAHFSKCSSFEVVKEYALREEDFPRLQKLALRLIQMSQKGYRLHSTEDIYSGWFNRDWSIEHQWHCTRPAWLTISPLARPYPCDDWQDIKFAERWPMRRVSDNWELFYQEWLNSVKGCGGCYWSTHRLSELMVDQEYGGDYFNHQTTFGKLLEEGRVATVRSDE